MKCRARIVLSGLSLVLLSVFAVGNDTRQQEGEALIEKARDLSSPQASASQPYRLKMRVRYMSAGSPKEGSYSEMWVSKTQWRREETFSGFTQTEIGSSEKRWVLRSAISGSGRLMAVPRLTEGMALRLRPNTRISKVRNEQWKGQNLRCLVTETARHSGRTYCFDKDAGLLRTIRDFGLLYEYADYATAGTKVFPRTFRVWEDKQLIIEATVEDLAFDFAPGAALFVPPPGAVAWANCDDIEYPKPLHTPDPNYPVTERNARVQGTTLLHMVVGTDGHTHDLAVLEAASQGFGAAAMAAVANWKFKPATCHGTPVAYEMSTEVNFRLY